jgi:iron(III) transport system permease protein
VNLDNIFKATRVRFNKLKAFLSKPQNVILILFGILLTFTTISPIVAIIKDTFVIHPGTIDSFLTGKKKWLYFYKLYRFIY